MDDAYAIAVAKSEYRDGYNQGDAEKVLSVFAPGFVDMSEGQPSVFGADARQALRRRLEELFAGHEVRLAPLIVDIVVDGDQAYDFGWHKVWIGRRGQAAQEGRLRYFERWKKQPDGSWKIVYLITNKEERPRMEPLSEVAAWRRVCAAEG